MRSDNYDQSGWHLAICFDESIVEGERGFDQNITIKNDGRAEFNSRFDVGNTSIWLVGKAYGLQSKYDIENWIANIDLNNIADWAVSVDGNWAAIVFDRVCNRVILVNDRNGASRIHYMQENGRVFISSSSRDIVRLLKEPCLSKFSAFTLLTTYYTLDPYTLIDGVKVVMPGAYVEVEKKGALSTGYFDQVEMTPDYFKTESECVREMDAAFSRVFSKRMTSQRTPMVLLSGGIDSVAMLSYITKVSKVPVHTLTFSVGGQLQTEHGPANIAAMHFGTVHHELIIDPSQVVELFIQACVEKRTPNVSTLIMIAIENFINDLGGDYDLFSGEDGRIHTPDFDWPKQLSIWLNMQSGGARMPRTQRLMAKLLRIWPWYPKNYLRHIAGQLEPQNSAKEFFLKHVNKFSVPVEFDLKDSKEFVRLLHELPESHVNSSVSDVFRQNLKLSHKLQHTDNMSVASSMESSSIAKHSPFFDWQAVEVFNRIPYHLGSRGIITFRSWSRFLMVNKRILRQVLKNNVPASILYRRKSVASAVDVLVQGGIYTISEKILDNWFLDYVDAVGPEVGDLSNIYIKKFRAGSLDMRVVYATLSICYMAILNQVCLNKEFDVFSELSILEKEINESI